MRRVWSYELRTEVWRGDARVWGDGGDVWEEAVCGGSDDGDVWEEVVCGGDGDGGAHPSPIPAVHPPSSRTR